MQNKYSINELQSQNVNISDATRANATRNSTSKIGMEDPQAVSITVFKKSRGKLTKDITYVNDKAIKDASECRMSEGKAVRRNVNMQSFYESLLDLNKVDAPKNIAIGQGISLHEDAMIASKSRSTEHPHAISRTKNNFYFPKGPALFLIDFDPSSDGPIIERDTLTSILSSIILGFGDAAKIIASSTSSGVYRWHPTDADDADFQVVERPPVKLPPTWNVPEDCAPRKTILKQEPILDASGLHLYVAVLDGSDIPRAGNVLFKRLWLARYGYIEISACGSLLVRTIVDKAVWSPERLDFCARPTLGEGLVQFRRDPEFLPGGLLDTRVALPDLSPAEEARYEELIARAKREKLPEAEKIRAQWAAERGRELASQHNIPERQVAAMVKQCIEVEQNQNGHEIRQLSGVMPIRFARNGQATAADVYMNPHKFDGDVALDPLDPGGENRFRAMCYANPETGQPIIHSFDSGGVNYFITRITIELRAGDVAEIVAEIEGALMSLTNPIVFQQGGELVQILHRKESSTRAILQSEGTAYIQPMTEPQANILFSLMIEFSKWDARHQKMIVCDPPERILKAFLGAGKWRLPVLHGLICTPIIMPDGRVIEHEGYDHESGLFLDFGGYQFPSVPKNPSDEDAQAAKNLLLDFISTFPFGTEADRSVIISAIMTGLVRRNLPTAPLHLIDATVAGSGKTLLADSIGELLTGQEPVTMSFTVDETESRKRWLAVLREGHPVILLDNIGIGQELGGDTLCTVLTKRSFADRVLGMSRTVTVSTNSLILATGNNTAIAGDMSRRVLVSRLDPGCEAPEMRRFKRDHQQYVRERRGELIVAALTLLKAFHLAGSPGSGLPPLGSFEAWSRQVRDALVWSGFVDPVETLKEARASDPERARLAGLLEAWRDVYGSKSKTVAQIIGDVRYAQVGLNDPKSFLLSELNQIGLDRSEKINPRTVGHFISAHKGRVINGMRFVQDGEFRHAAKWRIESVSYMPKE